MELLVALESHFPRYKGGVYSAPAVPPNFFQRYMAIFDSVRVLTRVREVTVSPYTAPVDDDNVTFVPLPDYQGPMGYLINIIRIKKVIANEMGNQGAILLRSPGTISHIAYRYVRRQKRPYGIEVVGDPYDVFAPGSNTHLLRPIFRTLFAWHLKQHCRHAATSSYVTKEMLQKRYPPKPDKFTTHYSSIQLPQKALVDTTRNSGPHQKKFRLIFVGTLSQLYKGPDVLIKAFAKVVSSGFDVEMIIVGDGQFRTMLEKLVNQLGIKKRVTFTGQLASGKSVLEQLDRSDLFLLPSYQEGKPRAMIEAMARGLPCIGSNVGGIPELLSAEDLVQPGNVDVLSAKIIEMISEPSSMARSAARNLATASNYIDSKLREKRNIHYSKLHEITSQWYSSLA